MGKLVLYQMNPPAIVFTDRELAMQSQEVLEAAGKECGIASVCVYGGVSLISQLLSIVPCACCLRMHNNANTQVSKWGQKQALSQGVEVVVATPGRLIDLMQEGIISLAQVNYSRMTKFQLKCLFLR